MQKRRQPPRLWAHHQGENQIHSFQCRKDHIHPVRQSFNNFQLSTYQSPNCHHAQKLSTQGGPCAGKLLKQLGAFRASCRNPKNRIPTRSNAWILARPFLVQKVPQPSKPTWVSVQDVVLNSLRPSTQPSQPLPELSHFYQTHKHRNISCSCRYGSCWCVTPWHKMMRSRQSASFC